MSSAPAGKDRFYTLFVRIWGCAETLKGLGAVLWENAWCLGCVCLWHVFSQEGEFGLGSRRTLGTGLGSLSSPKRGMRLLL